MALFGKLFEKKYCSVCESEIKLLGNRKLEDGNLCKNCAGKLSPFFSERRHSTVEDIKNQLAYREENRKEVAKFQVTRIIGRNKKILVDENQNKFMVTDNRSLPEENPDVMDLSQVTGCDFDIQENRMEEKRTVKNSDGSTRQVSYNPPHYEYSYNFKITLYVNHTYFDRIEFNLNNMNVYIKTVGDINVGYRGQSMGQVFGNAILQGVANALSDTMNMNNDPRMRNPEYQQYYQLGYEIKDFFAGAHQQIKEANVPKTAVTCPYCGATTIPDDNGCCEYCGGALNS